MCGIAGVFHLEGRPVERERLERMGRLLAHRGPDADGFYLQEGLGLVHRRLAIIDLDPRSQQPMEFEGCTLIYNGEIFNYVEIRQQLEDLGHRFVTESDSEVLIRAYLQWGRECLQRCNGMWAFALWDERRQGLWCARDRFGVKPFYFARREGEFRFASEPKALLGDDPGLRRMHLRAVGRFLVEGISDDEPETFFKGIDPLPPGHELWVSRLTGVQSRRYWKLHPLGLDPALELASVRLSSASPPPQAGFQEPDLPAHPHPQFYTAVEALRALLQDAVRLRLRSDVPVGTCLSGGMDSSSIVALASTLTSQPVRTFSSDYQEPDCCESEFITAVVDGCQTRATRVIPTPDELAATLDALHWAQDEPGGSASLFTQWKVMEAAHGQVTVLLDGQGGDEIFAGYWPYFEDFLWDQTMRGQENAEIGPARELTGVDYGRVVSKARWQRRLPAFLRKSERLAPDPFKPPALLHPDLIEELKGLPRSRTPRDPAWPDRLSRRLAHDVGYVSLPMLLRYEDRNSMAFSLEARTPFLDYRLVEFAFSLPGDFKIHRGWTKRVLRSAVAGLVPTQVVARRDKKGYPTPAVHWFRGPLKDWLREQLSSERLRASGWFQVAPVEAMLQSHWAGQDRSWELWRILSLLTWQRLFLEGQGFSG